MRMSAILSRLSRFTRLVAKRFAEDRCSRVAGALSYATLFALVPLSAVLVAVVSVFPVFRGLIDRVQTFVYQNFMPATGEVVSQYLAQFAKNAGKLTVWGLLFVFLAALMVLATIERTFNDIWHVRSTRKRVHSFLAYWATITAGPILIGVSLYVTSYIVSLPLMARGEMLGGFRTLLLYSLAPTAEWLAFLLLYTVVPNYPVRRDWRGCCHGAIRGSQARLRAVRGLVSDLSPLIRRPGRAANLPSVAVHFLGSDFARCGHCGGAPRMAHGHSARSFIRLAGDAGKAAGRAGSQTTATLITVTVRPLKTGSARRSARFRLAW